MGCTKLTYQNFNFLEVIHPEKRVCGEKKCINYYPFGLEHKGYNNVSTSSNLALKKTFNGKELQDDNVGGNQLNWYDFGARNYDPALGRWMNTDPLSEVTYELSPYNFTKNNPIKFTDPNGMIWVDPAEAEKLKGKINDTKESLAKTKTKLQGKLSEEGISDKKKAGLEKRIAGIDSRTESLDGTIADIDALGADQNHTFDLVSNSNETNHVKKGSDGVINIQGSTDALHIHEIKHTSLSLSSANGLQFNSNNLLKPALSPRDGYLDEVAGYKAQYGYSPSSLPGSVSDMSSIDLKYLAQIGDGKIYKALYKKYQNQIEQYKINEKNKKKSEKNGN